ncbi:VPLPA-CTERM sorting domain-containing protein [Rhabdochromatium marinum]|uniref:VPLPA-CTERM sorting domain-containing protein n=1 Tax=Rhabdochromatium marinum TaxID=48729 RepID=UPI001902FDEF|nr:VPLPA-CTERM sorting domain-containing protein [Rhabdochromatium marinum]
MKNSIFAVGIALVTLTGSNAYAAAISVSDFDIGNFNILTTNGTVEDFEGYAAGSWNSTTTTNVGKFSGLGGTGSGSTCTTFGTCAGLYLSDTSINGQGNILPTGGTKALQANDTYGMIWNVSNGSSFNQVVFGIRDAADQGATLGITAEWTLNGSLMTDTFELSGQQNGNMQLVAIDFGGLVSDATVTLSNNGRANDSFTLDAASTVSNVPVPAALPLFMSALASLGFVGFRRRNA